MSVNAKKIVWLLAAVIAAVLLLQTVRDIAGGNVDALPQLIVLFVVFAIAATGSVYYRSRSTDYSVRQREVINAEQSKLEKGAHGKS